MKQTEIELIVEDFKLKSNPDDRFTSFCSTYESKYLKSVQEYPKLLLFIILLVNISITNAQQTNPTGGYQDSSGFACPIMFPNAFSPNVSGPQDPQYLESAYDNNDLFHPTICIGEAEYISDYELNIYDKRGFMLYRTLNILHGWDGYYHQQLCPQEGYFWRMRYKYYGVYREAKGEFLLLQLGQ